MQSYLIYMYNNLKLHIFFHLEQLSWDVWKLECMYIIAISSNSY